MHEVSVPARSDRSGKKVAEYMVHFAGLKMETKRELINEWTKVSSLLESMDDDENKKTYVLPTLSASTDDVEQETLVCHNAVLGLLNVGRRIWEKSITDPSRPNNNSGRTGVASSRGKANIEIYKSFKILFFTELKEDALPFAT